MCVTFIYLNPDGVGNEDDYQLIVLNNRDENFDRPTSLAAWENDILAGRDEAIPGERGGTWLGMKRNGKIGILLSILEKDVIPTAPTRGRIVNEYLNLNCSAEEYSRQISHCAHKFNGFSLLLLDRIKLRSGRKAYHLVNFMNKHADLSPESLDSGVYGFGNNLRYKPFKKVSYGTKLLEEKVQQLKGKTKEQLLKECMEILRDNTCHHPDEQLMSQTNQHEDCSRAMSQLFYRFPHPHRYGTRSHTVILVDGVGHVTFLERSQVPPPKDLEKSEWVETKYEFDVEDDYCSERNGFR